MSYADERYILEKYFRDNWGSQTVTVFGNDNVTPPTDAPFVAMHVLPAGAVYAGMGSRPLGRFVGNIMVNIFVPAKTGTAEARRLADAVSTIFTNKSISGILCGIAQLRSVGGGGGPYQMNISIPFERDEEV